MNDIVVGVIALLTGAVFCFRGYLAMRLVIPLWGAFAGFMLGAGLVSGDAGFLGNALGWAVGFGLAIVFGLIAYLYYAVSVVIGMMAIGFVLGTSLMVALGVTWSWVIVLTGVVVASVLAFIAIAGDLPMVLLTVLTALAGASTMVAGLMLLFGTFDTEDFDIGITTEYVADDWWWFVIYGGLVVGGIVAQFTDVDRRRESLREAWSTGVGSTGSGPASAA
ncbi:MAG TPA: DUF4203 domain-containing protein [Ilumatobacteraceae bacterium]|nr:DUF4203 domain-containing protein [Ilumatobacteraceae bacterium]